MPDSDQREESRVYGQADDSNRTPPAPGGMRGENADPLATPDPDMAHEETLTGGRRVILEETNGVAFAEVTGRAGLDAQHDYQKRHEDDD